LAGRYKGGVRVPFIFHGENRETVLERVFYLIKNLEPSTDHELDLTVRHHGDEWVVGVAVYFPLEGDYHQRYREKVKEKKRKKTRIRKHQPE